MVYGHGLLLGNKSQGLYQTTKETPMSTLNITPGNPNNDSSSCKFPEGLGLGFWVQDVGYRVEG